MAVTITRSVWIDDDGTGTTGTVINQALHTTLYNEIDAALAKVAQLTGGNTFTGNQTIAGTFAVTAFGTHTIQGAGTGLEYLVVQNTAPGAANGAAVAVGNDISPTMTQLQSLSSTYTASGFSVANGSVLYAAGAGGLALVAGHASGIVKIGGGGVERMRIAADGTVSINSTGVPYVAKLGILADLPTTNALVLQNANVSFGNYLVFGNSANGVAGAITQTGATSVNYGTTSDARLKDDAGRATDLTALRAVVVHDFTWTGDGLRDRGVFAQDVHALYPRAVIAGTDDLTDAGSLARPWMTDYSKFVPDLVVGWQQHDAELTELRAILAAVKGIPNG